MLHWIFGGLTGAALMYGLAAGRGDQVVSAMLEGAGEAVQTAIFLTGAYGFFCGMLNILRQAGVTERLSHALLPFLKGLFGPTLPDSAAEPAAMNLTANLLGLGNAATPYGIEAARRMAGNSAVPSNALCLFLVINASSVQLLPTSVIALRAEAGSLRPAAIVWPTLAATGISTLAGIAACKLMEKIA